MVKKIFKTLLVTASCATLVVGGVAVTAQAAGEARSCAHSYTIVNDVNETWHYVDAKYHDVYRETEYYCMDCGAYFSVYDDYTDTHYGGNAANCPCE